MKQEILHLLKIVLIGLCCQEIAGHQGRSSHSRHRRPNRHAYEPLRQLPYYHNSKYYLPPRHHPHHNPRPRPEEPFPLKNGYYPPLPSPATFNNFPPFQQLDHPHLQYQSPDFPVFYHENVVHPPQFVQNVPLYYPVQNVQYEFAGVDQNQLGYHFYPYDPSLEKNQHNEIINIKAPIQIIPSRFPPRIEQIIERIQNYFSTYSHVDNQRPDYDPNLKPPLMEIPVAPTQSPNNTDVGNKVGNTTEEPITTTTERVEETTPREHQPEDDVEIIIITNSTEDADADGSSEVGIEVANKMGNTTDEPVDNQEEEQATEQSTEQTTEQENEEEQTTTDSNNEENSTENDVVIKVIALKRKSRRDNS